MRSAEGTVTPAHTATRKYQGVAAIHPTALQAAGRLSAEYFLRSILLLKTWGDGEMLTAIVALAIVRSNVSHLDRMDGIGATAANHSSIDPAPARRPVSVLALSMGLGLPYETTRRHVAKLLETGDFVRGRGGVVVAARAFDDPRSARLLADNLANLRRLFRTLKSAGVVLD